MHRTPPLHPVSEHMFIAWKSYCTFWNEVRKTNRLGRDGMAPKNGRIKRWTERRRHFNVGREGKKSELMLILHCPTP